MNILEQINKKFENFNSRKVEPQVVSEKNINQLISFVDIELPDNYLDILRTGETYAFGVKDASVLIDLYGIHDVLCMDDNYHFFREDVKQGVIIGSDLGDNIYYYGLGKEGLGLYIVGAGTGNYYLEAIKFAGTFTDFFVKGNGIDILDDYLNGIKRA